MARARATGADVLLATPTDPVGAPIIGATRGRVGVYIGHIWSIAQQHGAYVLNQWACDFLKDWRMWAEDRIHLTPEGHRRVALAAYIALGHSAQEADWRAAGIGDFVFTGCDALAALGGAQGMLEAR